MSASFSLDADHFMGDNLVHGYQPLTGVVSVTAETVGVLMLALQEGCRLLRREVNATGRIRCLICSTTRSVAKCQSWEAPKERLWLRRVCRR